MVTPYCPRAITRTTSVVGGVGEVEPADPAPLALGFPLGVTDRSALTARDAVQRQRSTAPKAWELAREGQALARSADAEDARAGRAWREAHVDWQLLPLDVAGHRIGPDMPAMPDAADLAIEGDPAAPGGALHPSRVAHSHAYPGRRGVSRWRQSPIVPAHLEPVDRIGAAERRGVESGMHFDLSSVPPADDVRGHEQEHATGGRAAERAHDRRVTDRRRAIASDDVVSHDHIGIAGRRRWLEQAPRDQAAAAHSRSEGERETEEQKQAAAAGHGGQLSGPKTGRRASSESAT